MTLVPDAVPEESLDYDEVIRRGGANYGDEDFALCKCPHCGQVYLIDYEVDTLYLDPANLDRRIALNIRIWSFNCEKCLGVFPEDVPWIGKKSPESMQVTWQDLEASPWRWITARTR